MNGKMALDIQMRKETFVVFGVKAGAGFYAYKGRTIFMHRLP